ACFDADPADAEAACRLLSGTLHPSLEVCDGTKGTCGAMKQVRANCCQCPEPSPPFPHPGYCFDTNISSCGPVCTKTAGPACGPDSQTCGWPRAGLPAGGRSSPSCSCRRMSSPTLPGGPAPPAAPSSSGDGPRPAGGRP